jgi:hypothetical protein
MLVTSPQRAASDHRPTDNHEQVGYQYDGYPNGAASTVQYFTPAQVLQGVPNRQPATTNVPHWIDPTLEQGVGRDSTWRNGWMKKAYVSDYSILMINSSQWPTLRPQLQKQHRPSTGFIQLAQRNNTRHALRAGNLPAPVNVAYTAQGGEPL